MNLREYQRLASRTDRVPLPPAACGTPEGVTVLVPMLGLAGEVGSLLAEYKKYLRDGDAHRLYREQVADDLDDLLWYAANVATKFGLDLEEVAAANLAKTQDRWPTGGSSFRRLFDEGCPQGEQLPRNFEIRVEQTVKGGRAEVTYWLGEKQVGNALTDNAYDDDGYRFHDVLHFGYAAVLAWSPVLREHLGCKRGSDPKTKEVEDRGRAKVIEEAVVALDYARKHNYLTDVKTLDYTLLKTIKGLVADREVRVCSMHDWEQAIFSGYRVWRLVREHNGGVVVGDLIERTLDYRLVEPRAKVVVRG